MRIGSNPLRYKPAPYTFKNIVLLVVTHLPCEEQAGYHTQRMEVVKTCLTTMRERCNRDVTMMVWDNDSKSEFRDWLQHIFEPDILIMSQNIGKNPARAFAVNMMPLSSIVAYSDDDMYYYDNWLNPQIEILNHFPNVSVVSGYPVRTQFRWGNEHTMKWARENGTVTQGRFMPEQWERDFCASIGRDYENYHIGYTLKDVDYKVKYEGKEAYLTSHHCQFIGYAATLRNHLYTDNMAMSDERTTDIELDKAGLRLCTTQRLCRHIGNVLDDSFKEQDAERLQEQV